MARRRLLLPLLALALTAADRAPPGSVAAITPAMLRRHVAILASDDYGGRAPGTEVGQKAERYVAGRFRAAGLRPAAPGGGWFQRVPAAGGSDNIVGKAPGRDPARGAVFLLAHWDHLGRCRTIALDRVCNGAIDNASGVATLIEVARAVVAGPRPIRDVYFVATTGEERGLLGARALADRPPVPLARIAALFNLDTVAVAPAGAPVGIVGRGRTALDPLILAVAGERHRTIAPGTLANAYLDRQDGWVFLQRGVPAVMVGGAFGDLRPLRAFLASRYHAPDDDLAHAGSFAGAAEDADLDVALVRAFADPSRFPGEAREPARAAL